MSPSRTCARARGAPSRRRARDRWLACLPFRSGRRSVIDGAASAHERFDAAAVAAGIYAAVAFLRWSDLARPAAARARRAGRRAAGRSVAARRRRPNSPAPAGLGSGRDYVGLRAASQVAMRRPGGERGSAPLPGTRVRIATESGASCAAGEPGRSSSRAKTAMRGYWRRPDDTSGRSPGAGSIPATSAFSTPRATCTSSRGAAT
jgi:hypothetical protein